MSDAVIIAIIVGASQVITALLSLLTYRKISGLHHEMNSMKDSMVQSARVEGHAQGMKDEKAKPS